MTKAVRLKVMGAAMAVVAVMLAGCTGSAPGDSGPAAEVSLHNTTAEATGDYGPITWANYRAPSSLDPIQAADQPENAVIDSLCEGLLMQQPDGTIAPWLAESADYSSPTTLVIKLRQGVTFWDGAPMTAADVAYSLDRARNPEGSYYATQLSAISSVTATASDEVSIALSRPDYWLRGELAAMPGIVIQKAFAERAGKNYGSAPGNVMCTGPFTLKSWQAGGDLVIERNPSYWDSANAAHVSQITFTAVGGTAEITAGLLSGSIDGIYNPLLGNFKKLTSSSTVRVTTGENGTLDMLQPLDLAGVLGDVRVRKALSLAIDRQAYLNVAYPGGQASLPSTSVSTRLWSDFSVVSDVFGDEEPMRQDLTEAKKLIAEAGAVGKPLVMATADLPSITAAGNVVLQAGNALGLKVELKNFPIAQYASIFYDPKAREGIDLVDTLGAADYYEPGAFLATYAEAGGLYNLSGWSDEKVTELLEKARATSNLDAREALEAQADKIVTDNMVWIPLVEQHNNVVMSTEITGAPASYAGYMAGPWARMIGAAK